MVSSNTGLEGVDEADSNDDRPWGKLTDEVDPFDDDEVGEITDMVDEVDAFDELRGRLPLAALLANGFFPRPDRGLLLEEGPAPLPILVSI